MAVADRTSPGTSPRAYEESHAHINFVLDLSGPNPDFWMMLGEARSKVDHIARSPMRPEAAMRMHHVYLAKGVLGTTAIEGNTLTQQEVEDLIDGRLELPPSRQYLAQEVQNILDAFNSISHQMFGDGGGPEPLSPEVLAEYNREILKGLELDPGVVPGEIPTHRVTVGRYLAPPRQDVPYLLERLCDWLNSDAFEPPQPDREIPWAILKAIVAHLYFAWIHPFGDGNGRTARLVELRVLVEAGVPLPAAHLLSNHYNLTRTEYYRQLDATSRVEEGELPFMSYALAGLLDGLRTQLDVIREQQLEDRWVQYVHEQFTGRHSDPDHRRRDLLLAISEQKIPVPRAQINTLTPDLAVAYAGKTSKTVSRDLNVLEEMELIERDAGQIRPRIEILEAFLPQRTRA